MSEVSPREPLLTPRLKSALLLGLLAFVVMLICEWMFARSDNAYNNYDSKVRTIANLQADVNTCQKSLPSYALGEGGSTEVKLVSCTNDIARIIDEMKLSTTRKEAREQLDLFIGSYDRWTKELAYPVIAKRRQVEQGKATLAELNALYLSCSPAQKNADLETALSNLQVSQLGGFF